MNRCNLRQDFIKAGEKILSDQVVKTLFQQESSIKIPIKGKPSNGEAVVMVLIADSFRELTCLKGRIQK